MGRRGIRLTFGFTNLQILAGFFVWLILITMLIPVLIFNLTLFLIVQLFLGVLFAIFKKYVFDEHSEKNTIDAMFWGIFLAYPLSLIKVNFSKLKKLINSI